MHTQKKEEEGNNLHENDTYQPTCQMDHLSAKPHANGQPNAHAHLLKD